MCCPAESFKEVIGSGWAQSLKNILPLVTLPHEGMKPLN